MSKSSHDPERVSKRRKLSPPTEASTTDAQTKSTKASKKTKRQPIPANITSENLPAKPTELPPVKGLDSSEASIRRKALQSILTFLNERDTSTILTSLQCLQLWRGFFVVTYMHDSKNAISVQNLLKDLAGTFTTLAMQNDYTSLKVYHTAFHETLIREWAGIDSHRMNKYLMLARFVLRNLFLICLDKPGGQKPADDIMSGQELEITKQILEVLQTTGPMNPSDRKIPDGVRLHFLDIWNDEFFASMAMAELSKQDLLSKMKDVVDEFKKPLVKISKSDSGAQRHIRLKAKEVMVEFDERIATELE